MLVGLSMGSVWIAGRSKRGQQLESEVREQRRQESVRNEAKTHRV